MTGSRGVLVSAAGPQMRDILHDLALPSFRRFASQWGYRLHVVDLAVDVVGADAAAQQAKWMKVGLLRAALTKFPLALWLDADVLLVRHDEDIAQHLHPDHFQALALEHVPHEHRVNPNTGVWLMRSCPAALAFLDAVEAAGPPPGPWADQGAVLAALGWHRGDGGYCWARPGPGNQFTAGTSWLPVAWNQPYLGDRLDEELFNGCAASYRDPAHSHRPTCRALHGHDTSGALPAHGHTCHHPATRNPPACPSSDQP